MMYETGGNGPGVLELLLLKKHLREIGDLRHKHIRIVLFVLSGTMRGVFGAGEILALIAAGITADLFEVVVGVSTGAVAAACYVANQHWIVPNLYRGFCLTDEFISPPPRQRIGIEAIADFLRGHGHEALDVAAIRASTARLLIAVTNAETGAGELCDACTTDVVQAILASTAAPGLTSGPVLLGNQRCLDGVGGTPLPLEHVLRQYKPGAISGILVLANRPEPDAAALTTEARSWRVLARKLLEVAAKNAFITSGERFTSELALLRRLGIPYGIVWTDPFDPLERDPEKVEAALKESENYMTQILDKARLLTA